MNCPSLTSVTFPASVITIGAHAFYYCSSLTEVVCNAVSPPTLENYYDGLSHAFEGTSSSLQIKVPAGSVNDYQAAAHWSSYRIVAQ